jgi:hypothetical protein
VHANLACTQALRLVWMPNWHAYWIYWLVCMQIWHAHQQTNPWTGVHVKLTCTTTQGLVNLACTTTQGLVFMLLAPYNLCAWFIILFSHFELFWNFCIELSLSRHHSIFAVYWYFCSETTLLQHRFHSALGSCIFVASCIRLSTPVYSINRFGIWGKIT